jgi:hypothetical protein
VIVLSLVLVIVAAVTLVLGVFQDGLTLIYVSIGTCLAAMVLLGVGVLMRRREDAQPASSGYGPAAGARPQQPAAGSGGDEEVRIREATDDTEVRPARKAVVKKVSATPTVPERETTAEQPGVGRPAAGAAAAGAAAAGFARPRRDEDAEGDDTPAAGVAGERRAPVKKAVVKKAVKKAAVKKVAAGTSATTAATKKGVAKKSAKKATAKRTAAKKAPAGSASLPDVKGLGPAKKKALLDAFGSVDNIRSADVSELAAVKGVGAGLAAELKRQLEA